MGLPMRSCRVTPKSTPTKWWNRMELEPNENTAQGAIASKLLAPVDVANSQHPQRIHPHCEQVANEDSQRAGDYSMRLPSPEDARFLATCNARLIAKFPCRPEAACSLALKGTSFNAALQRPKHAAVTFAQVEGMTACFGPSGSCPSAQERCAGKHSMQRRPHFRQTNRRRCPFYLFRAAFRRPKAFGVMPPS